MSQTNVSMKKAYDEEPKKDLDQGWAYDEEPQKDLDQGWAWVMLFAATTTVIITGMCIYCAGVLHIALLQKFEEDNAYTSLIGSIFTSLLSLGGPFASMMINRFSCRVALIVGGVTTFVGFSASFFMASNLDVLLITYGIIAGMGLSLSTIPAIVVVGYFFHRKQGFAAGVVMSGASIGMFIAGPLTQTLLNEYGLQGTFLILAAIASNIIVAGALMRPSDLEYKHKRGVEIKQSMEEISYKSNNKLANSVKNILHVDILLNKSFICCCLQYCMWNMGFSILLLHLPTYSVIQGSDTDSSALLITYIGIGSTFGRILTGVAIGNNGIDPVLLNFGLNGLVGLLTVLFPYYSHLADGRIIYAFLFGLYSGGLSTMINPLCIEFLGIGKVSSGVGILFCAGGVGYLIGPPISGFIVDEGGTFNDSFYLCGCLFLLGAIFTIATTISRTPRDSTEFVVSFQELQQRPIIICSSTLLNNINISVEVIPENKTKNNVILEDSDREEIQLCEKTPLTYESVTD